MVRESTKVHTSSRARFASVESEVITLGTSAGSLDAIADSCKTSSSMLKFAEAKKPLISLSILANVPGPLDC
jgi:hypothetical protein